MPTSPIPTMRAVSPGWTLEERRALMLTPAMRPKTASRPSISGGNGRAIRPVSALTQLAWREKLKTRSPGLHMVTAPPTSTTSPTLPYPVVRGYWPRSWKGICFTKPVKPAPSVPPLTTEY